MNELKIGTVFISKQKENSEYYEKIKDVVKEKNIKIVVIGQGDKINIENNLFFDILWPNKENLLSENALNNNSIVCKLQYKNFSMLFTGDIEEKTEKEIINKYKKSPQKINSTILKVAHHGSKTSSTEEFLKIVNPQIALIGVGEKNIFGHPNEQVIERLNNNGCIIYRTDTMGEITAIVNNKGKIEVDKCILNNFSNPRQ